MPHSYSSKSTKQLRLLQSVLLKLSAVSRENQGLLDTVLSLRSANVRLEDRLEVLEHSGSENSSEELMRLVDRKDERIRDLEAEIQRLKAELARPRIPSSPIPPPMVSKPLLTQRITSQHPPAVAPSSESRRRSVSKNRLAQSISGPLSEMKPVLSTRPRVRKSLSAVDRN